MVIRRSRRNKSSFFSGLGGASAGLGVTDGEAGCSSGLVFPFLFVFCFSFGMDDVGFGLRLSAGVRADVGVQPEGRLEPQTQNLIGFCYLSAKRCFSMTGH